MIKYKTLENVSVTILTETFNKAFSEYFVPLQLTKEQLELKFKSENVALYLSVGAFYNNQLVGFIFHCIDEINDKKKLYNGGTGVIKEFRGKQITQKMYDFILPKLIEKKVSQLELEVFKQNTFAINSYLKIGFIEQYELICYQTKLEIQKINSKIEILKVEDFNWNSYKTFWNIEPTWQNGIETMNRIKQNITVYEANIEKKLVGYLIFNNVTNRIHQLAVHSEFRKKGIGRTLLNQLNNKNVSIINLPNVSKETLRFYENIGFRITAEQIKMQKELKVN